jgi:predicted acyltransferase
MAMQTETPRDKPPATIEAPKRLQSLDALRGFVMFWIIGGDALAKQLAKATDRQPFVWLGGQMEHPLWNGFRFYDAIFPIFLFAAGAALPFSSLRRVSEGKSTRTRELLIGARRALILFLLGMVINGVLRGHWGEHMHNVRFGSVLGRIGIAWFLALAISLFCGWRGRLIWFIGLLLGYWAAMELIPVPGHGAGDLTQGANLCDYIDQLLMPGRLYRVNHDPEGLFSTIPAIGTALLGVLAGGFLRSSSKSAAAKAYFLALAGLVAIGVALLWNFSFPINKNLWSSSFVLMAGGIGLIVFSIFHWLMEARGWTATGFFFVVIGANSIAIYVATEGLVDFYHTSRFLFSGAINARIPPDYQAWREVAITIATIAVEWFCLWFLWRKKVFIRV